MDDSFRIFLGVLAGISLILAGLLVRFQHPSDGYIFAAVTLICAILIMWNPGTSSPKRHVLVTPQAVITYQPSSRKSSVTIRADAKLREVLAQNPDADLHHIQAALEIHIVNVQRKHKPVPKPEPSQPKAATDDTIIGDTE